MKIAFNPSTVAALTTPPNNKDITFDLRGHSIFARGVEFKGTDTNTWRDIKINNVSIGSHTLDLRNGSNTTLTNTNGVVTINSTWRPVVDNLTSDSTTSSLSAKQGKVLKALIDGKSNSDHNHDGRYVRYYAVTTLDCNNLASGLTVARVNATNAGTAQHSAYLYISDVGTPFQIQIPDSGASYIYKRYYSSGKWSGWFKLNAGYADSAGSVAWANVTGKPSSYTPSAHTHAWNSLTHSSTTENQAILTNGKANGWKLQTLNIARWDNAANNAHSHANKSVLDGITSALVNSWNTAYNFVSNITGTDTDKIINKWEEIVNFLAGITEDNKLNTLLNSKLSVYELANNTNVGTIKNNGIYYSTTDASSSTLTNSPFNNGFALINMTSYDIGDDLRRSRLAFNAYGEIKVSDDRGQSNTAETWYNVLTSKNSGINGSTIKLNGTSITVYSSGTADGRYLRLTGGWMSGDINFGGDNKIHWVRNTDSASISFKNDGDGDANSYMSFVTSNNGNEYFRWSHSSGSTNTEWMALRGDGLRVRGTKVSLEGHSHNDLYYTKAESNAKYITDITTSVNKLTFTRNGSNIIRDITVNVVHSQGQLPNIPNKDATTKANPGLLIYNSYNQTIGTNPYSSVLSINTGGTIQIAGNWGDDQTRNLYWRSQSDRNVADYPWKSWRTILDSENYSSTLDSRYYTESEVNSLLDAKLNRQNLSYGTWNPRGYHLAADYHYNGGDLSISENNGKMYVSVDGCFWQNEGQYRVLDTSDIGDIRDSVTLHQYLSATDAAWYPLVWGGNAHNNTSDSTGAVYKSYDKLSWQTSSQTLYATNIQTNNIKNLSIGGGIYWNPNVESASDGSDAASITLVRQGVAGGTTLVLSQMNDTNDTIQFKTNTAARLYHNSYPILTTQNTYVNNNKGYINGTEITQVNNSDTLDGAHLSDIKNWSDRTASAYWKAGWYKVASAQTATNTEAFLTLDVNATQSNGHATLFIRKRADSKPYFICTHNNNLNLADFRLYYNGMSMVLYARVPNDWNGRVFRIISEGREGTYDHIWTLYSNVSSTDPNAISAEGGNPYINPTYSGRVDWSNSSDKANYANSAGSVAWNNVTGKPSAFNPAAHTHTVFKNNLMIKGTNGISDSASIHLGIGDSDTGFKWISDGVCQIYANNVAVGQWTSGGMNWFKNPTVNGNKVWNAGNDGSGSGLDADTLDGYHANGNNDRPYGHIPTIESDGVMEVGRYIDFHNDNNGKHDFSTRLQSTGNYGNEVNLPSASGTLALINDVNNYYWANVKISTSSSTTTSPTVHTLTATRVCAGHNPGIDNSISCSNWFRSSGNTGWYNTTYQGGWYMSDTFWIRAHNGVGIYTGGQIYSSSSIRMSNILLEHTDEINNSANGGIHLNYRNSGNVSLCCGGGNVGIGTTTPSYKLDVNGQMRAGGFHHSSVNSDNYILLAGGGYKSFGGDDSTPIFLGCLDLYRGDDGTISSSFYCLGYSVPFTYTRGGNYCKIVIPDTSRLSFYTTAAIASVNYSRGGMDTWVGEHRGDGAWWLHCQAFGWNEVRVKGFRLANGHNDSWWGGNPLYSDNGGANKITVCIFGHVKYK